ncbi:MAG: TlpA family protein disulfide reductase [Hyphomicrobium sp.]
MKPKDNADSASRAILILIALVSAVITFLAIYVTLGSSDNWLPSKDSIIDISASEKISESKARVTSSHGISFIRTPKVEKAPLIEFLDQDGVTRSLSDFRGKNILLNLWATWCVPCREEMPSLDRLQKDMGSDEFEVVALSLDRAGKHAAEKFFSEINIQNLRLYVDSTMKAGNALRAVGMPTTILIDKDGNERARMPGPARWDSPETKALILQALN